MPSDDFFLAVVFLVVRDCRFFSGPHGHREAQPARAHFGALVVGVAATAEVVVKVWELRALLETVPDYWEVGIEVQDHDDTEVIPLEGRSPSTWTHMLSLVANEPGRRVALV